jgi:TusE/DsrC/DsvC family sulfur relay protein
MDVRMDLPMRDGDGYLVDMNAWTPEIGMAMAKADGFAMTDEKWEQVLKAREYFEDSQSAPPIRKFAAFVGRSSKEMFDFWDTGPMKPITKYGGLPKPTGCV